MRKRNTVMAVAIFLCVCLMGVAYAQLSSQIVIEGSAAAAGSFDVVFDETAGGGVNYTAQTDDGIEVTAEFVDSDTVAILADKFREDNDSVVIVFTVRNAGTMNACIDAADIVVNVPESVSPYFTVVPSVAADDMVIAPGSTGEVSVTVTCTDHEPLRTFSGVTVTLGYHQQTVESAPEVTHIH